MYYVLQLAKALLKYKNHSTKHLITEYEKFNNTSKYKWEKKKKKKTYMYQHDFSPNFESK